MAEREAIQIVKKVPEYTIVPTDPHLMKVILNNLIGNAITHAGRGAVVVGTAGSVLWTPGN
ncbi:MAG: HAMP domain-containing histidine kinase [Flavobacteriales bacterium]|nr:HAMP domain-containing histidine kinase [Flavobacteriales bacterium]